MIQTPPKTGIWLVDKPSGWTSHDVVAWVRHQTGVKRVGHAGTLDPLATGLLIILIGRDFTKQQDTFLKQDKVYEVEFELGKVSDTYDQDGQLETTASSAQLAEITEAKVKAVIDQFVGVITQQVPAYSAVKIQGAKLYNLARSGQVTAADLPSRTVTIYEARLQSLIRDTDSGRTWCQLIVKCSSGTYIRSLVSDVGKALEVGAVVTKLRRTQIGTLSVDQAASLVNA